MTDKVAPKHPCDGEYQDANGMTVKCPNTVSTRRPSDTGTHWCSNPPCQAAKQRYFRAKARRDREAARSGSQRSAVHALIHDLLNLERKPCSGCGLPNSLPGWYHRSGPGAATPCYDQGSKGRDLPPGTLDVVWPERASA